MPTPAEPWSLLDAGAGRYQVLETIQRGGMGEVILAEYLEPSGRRVKVVLKRLLPGFNTDERYAAMFLSEAQVMSSLHHPNIVKVVDTPLLDGKQCLALEYVHGVSVQQVIRRCEALGAPMPAQVALHIAGEVLRGLAYAHAFQLPDGRSLELVHRDITPGNLLVSFDGEVKITDFGIAKSRMSQVETTAGVVKGTTRYLSPEQIRGDEAAPTSDLFSLAVVLVEMLTGVAIFDRGTVPPTLLAIASGERPPLGQLLPFHAPFLAATLERALAVNAAERPQSAPELSTALQFAAAEIGPPIDRAVLAAFLRELFAPAATEGGGGGDELELTYLFELSDPWSAADAADQEPRQRTGARPLDAVAFAGAAPGAPPPVRASTPLPTESELLALPFRRMETPPPPVPPASGVAELQAPPVPRGLTPPGARPLMLGESLPAAEPRLTPSTSGGAPPVLGTRSVPPASTSTPALGRPPAPGGPPPPVPAASERESDRAAPAGGPPAAPPRRATPPPPPPPEREATRPVAAEMILNAAPERAARGGWRSRLALFAAGIATGALLMRALTPVPSARVEPPPSPTQAARPAAGLPLAEPVAEPVMEAPAPPAVGFIDLRRPRGARLVLDGVALPKRSPLVGFEVAPGSHRLVVIKGGSKKSYDFVVEPGARLELGPR